MGLEMGAWLIIGIGLAYLASRLLASKQPKPTLDQKPSTTSERGTFIPWVLGKRKVGPIIGWVGDRSISYEEIDSGGSKKSSSSKATIYNEGGWHMLNCKPSYALTRITQGGKVIFEGPITNITHPTGSLINLGVEGSFYIYWGDQTTGERNSYLNTFVGIDSSWPNICYIVWAKKRLGPSPHWPLLEYEIDARPTNSVLSQSTAVLGQGLNPAHCIAELLFAEWPNGLNLDQDDWDIDSLEAVGVEAAADSTRASFMAADGEEASGVLAGFLQDYGYMLPVCQTTGKVKFVPIREPTGTIKEIKEEMLLDPLPEIVTNHGERPIDQMIFMFPDRKHRYRDMTIAVAADGQADYLTHSRAQRVGLRTVVDFDPAATLSERRGQEERAGGATVTIHANHAARTLEPGEPLICSGIEEILRISAVKAPPKSGKVKITCITDFYAAKKSAFVTDEGGGDLDFQAPAEDLATGFVEIPEFFLGGIRTIFGMFLKIRAHSQITGSGIWIKLTADSDYTYIGNTSVLITGGELLEELPASGPHQVTQGPLIDDLGPDVSSVTDQTEVNWRTGRQLAVINQEIMFLDELTADGGDFRMDGILRGRYGTKLQTHAVGDPVFIFGYDVIQAITDLIFSVGASLDIILQPSSGSGSVDFSTLTKITHSMVGKGIIPLRVPNLRVTAPRHMVPAYETGEDITFEWGYMSSLSSGTGAGSQGYGNPVGRADVDGQFILEIWNTGDTAIVRSETLDTLTYTYTNVNLLADHLGEPVSFPVRIYNIRGGYESEKTLVTVVKET